ncbi:hypothetical protein BVX97_01705 [bacterium E08(2017)]|nr:hypothetical protein BVX97_01705 [bacterium E08(2017)]
MKTVHRHITADYLVTFLITLLVFTFVMCIGVMFQLKVGDLLAKGWPWAMIFKIIACGIPMILSYALPISVLTSSLLVFGRLSSDGEITAMRACGISAWTIASRPLMFSLLLSVLCLYANSVLAPRAHYVMKTMKVSMSKISPLDLFDEGKFITGFKGYTIYVGKKNKGIMENIRVYDTSTDVRREILAQTGTLEYDSSGTNLVLKMNEVRLDPIPGGNNEAGYAESYSLPILSSMQQGHYEKDEDDWELGEIAARIGMTAEMYPDVNPSDVKQMDMALKIEFNKRLVLGLSCFAFTILGIPLGIKSHRKESSAGVAMGLFTFFCFYLFIAVAEELVEKPELRPDWIVWAPVLISTVTGGYLLKRSG